MLWMCHHKEHCRQQTCRLWLGVEASTRPPGGSSVGRSSVPWGSVPSEWVPPPGVPGHAPGKWCLGAGCFLVALSQSAATGPRGQSLVERWVSHEIVEAAKTLCYGHLKFATTSPTTTVCFSWWSTYCMSAQLNSGTFIFASETLRIWEYLNSTDILLSYQTTPCKLNTLELQLQSP